jgi:DNA-directed RNA polymerase specialized sigma24 family protein
LRKAATGLQPLGGYGIRGAESWVDFDAPSILPRIVHGDEVRRAYRQRLVSAADHYLRELGAESTQDEWAPTNGVRETDLVEILSEVEPEDVPLAIARMEHRIAAALARLSDAERELAEVVLGSPGCTLPAIASALNISHEAARKRFSRLLKRISCM